MAAMGVGTDAAVSLIGVRHKNDYQWACPLAPPENWVEQEIRAGELTYHQA
jgi:hypothetical protein